MPFQVKYSSILILRFKFWSLFAYTLIGGIFIFVSHFPLSFIILICVLDESIYIFVSYFPHSFISLFYFLDEIIIIVKFRTIVILNRNNFSLFNLLIYLFLLHIYLNRLAINLIILKLIWIVIIFIYTLINRTMGWRGMHHCFFVIIYLFAYTLLPLSLFLFWTTIVLALKLC